MTDAVLFDRRGAVGYITLNRPDAGNAIDVPLARCLLEAAVAAEADTAVRCVVVRGGGRMFCAGGDVKRLHAAGDALPDLLRDILASLHPAISCLATMGKPVVTAIHGPAAGAGVGLAAVGDIALAEPDAHFTVAYSRIGLTPDGGATWLLPRLIGLRRTQELALTNRRVSAEEAAAMGLITRVVARGTLEQEVDTLAEALARGPVGALGRTKRLLMASSQADLDAQLEAEAGHIAAQGGTAESRTGIAAFIERREPDFAA
jgi:2-(1,2-epoxy-1,2-dihydrophenyl)acetyl-CoA isomerase